MTELEPQDSVTGYVLTLDIVDFSLRTSAAEQRHVIQDFIALLKQVIPPELAKNLIWSPAGDGGAFTFIGTSFNAPIDMVVRLFVLLNKYNTGDLTNEEVSLKKPGRPLQIRAGIHTGPVSLQKDFDQRVNVWGNGINMSARLITLARPGQILVSAEYYETAELGSGSHPYTINSIGKRWVKHNKSINVYNVYAEGLGVGVPFDESDLWFSSFQAPLQQAIRTYQGMLADEYADGSPFRVAVLAKRLLDLDTVRSPVVDLTLERQRTQSLPVKDVIRSISHKKHSADNSRRNLYDLFLSPFSSDALGYFFENASFANYSAGEILAKEHDRAEDLMIIVCGTVGVYRSDPQRGEEKKRVVDRRTRHEVEVEFGEHFIVGEMGLFSPDARRNATMKAEQPTIVLRVPYSCLSISAEHRNTVDYSLRLEVRGHIWKYYCDRTKDNHLSIP